MLCSVCKMPHTNDTPSKVLTRAYITREYRKEVANGGNGTTTAIRLSDNRRNTADYFHVIHAINELNREEEQP